MFSLVIGPDTVWEVWGLMMPHVQLSNVIELNHCQAVMKLALQDSVKRTAMHCFLAADMLKPMMRHLVLWAIAIHDMCHECRQVMLHE